MKKAVLVVLTTLCLFTIFLGGVLRYREVNALSNFAAAEGMVPSVTTQATDPAFTLPDARQLGVGEEGSLGPEPYIPAKLYIAPGYYLYIPKEGWNLKQTFWSQQDPEKLYAGVPSHLWATPNGRSELRIAAFPYMDADLVRKELLLLEPDYHLSEGKQGGLLGLNEDDGTLLEIQLIPYGRSILMVSMRYPMENMESDGYAMRYMADSLVIYDEQMLGG